jgi:hypothetical protein
MQPTSRGFGRRQTRINAALKGVRGRQAVNLPALEELLVRFSQLAVEQRWICPAGPTQCHKAVGGDEQRVDVDLPRKKRFYI